MTNSNNSTTSTTKRSRYTYDNADFYYDEFHIQKRHGKTRRICAPSPALKAYQRTKLDHLYIVFDLNRGMENLGSNIFHGFLPNRNIVTAARQHIGYDTTIQMDISNCFDSIRRESVSSDTCLSHEDGTLAQGFVTSPILSNIYLIKPIADIIDKIEKLSVDYAITVYADDITISLNTEDYNLINLVPHIVSETLSQYDLRMNPAKTRVRYAKHGLRKILGIMVGQVDIYPSRKLKRKMRAARHQSNGPSLGGLTTASRMLIPRSLR